MQYSNIEKVYKFDRVIGTGLRYLPYMVLILTFLIPFTVISIVSKYPEGAFWVVMLLIIIPLSWGLSPLWSKYHMWKSGGRPITSEEWDYIGGEELNQIIEKVLPEKLRKKLKFYVVDVEDMNAFCMYGGKIAIYRGVFRFDKRIIQAIILHELGHYYLGHVQILNMIGYSQIGLYPKYTIGKLRRGTGFLGIFSPGAWSFMLFIPTLVWEFICLTLMGGFAFRGFDIFLGKLYRLHEYEADLFACQFGYEKELYEFLKLIQHIEVRKVGSLHEKLYRTHPYTAYRIDKIYRYIQNTN